MTRCSIVTLAIIALYPGVASAVDVTFNITLLGESNPIPPKSGTNFSYADVWTEGGYAYVGSDRTGQGMAIFSIADPTNPVFLMEYAGSELEDVEIHDGIGFFGSDVNPPGTGTGVDIVDLSIPFDPILLSRVDSSIGGHNKVHTLSVNNGFLYTADNATDVVKIFNVADPSNPHLAKSLDLGAPSGVASHEVVARDNRLYVASKNNSSTTCCGWTHIYDVADPYNPVLLKAFLSGPRTHTSMPNEDHSLLIVTEERPNGEVHIYDISMINQPNDPNNPVLLATLNRSNVGIAAHSPHHPHVHGSLLFITWYEAGLQVFNIADPTNPIHVGAFDTYPGTSTGYNGNWGVDISLGAHTVLLSDRSRGLLIVDASGVLAPGDYDHDGLVDAEDYNLWRSFFGDTLGGLHHGPAADGNNNGVVDAADYVVWRKHVGQIGPSNGRAIFSSSGSSVAVPEPSAVMLWALALGIVALRRLRSAE